MVRRYSWPRVGSGEAASNKQAAVDLPLEDRMATITGQAEVCFEGRTVATRVSALRDTFLPHSVPRVPPPHDGSLSLVQHRGW